MPRSESTQGGHLAGYKIKKKGDTENNGED